MGLYTPRNWLALAGEIGFVCLNSFICNIVQTKEGMRLINRITVFNEKVYQIHGVAYIHGYGLYMGYYGD